jgi:exosortase
MSKVSQAAAQTLASFRALTLAQRITAAVVGAAVLWAYGSTLLPMVRRWSQNPQYSHGFLVPLFALALLWLRRDKLDSSALRPSWWGLGVLALAVALRLFGAFYFITWFDDLSLLPCLTGLCLLAGGWAALRWAWPSLAFLFFMIPLPYAVETALAHPLRLTATETSAFVLQTLGFPALSEGTDIHLGDQLLQVAPACSGMGMLLVFFTLSTAIALLIDRPWVDKVVIVASAIPIALVANTIRITITGILYQLTTAERAKHFFHDSAGWGMMLVALLLLGLELKILDWMFITEDTSPARAFDFTQPAAPRMRAQAPETANKGAKVKSPAG